MRFVTSLLLAIVASAQTPPVFEVASVKLTSHGRDANGLSVSSIEIVSPGRLVGTNSSMSECVRYAWNLKDYQLAGPAWLNDDNASYDIEAKAPGSTPEPEMRKLLQALLAERFGVQVHRETRSVPVYNLIALKTPVRLTPASLERESGFLSRGSADSVRISAKAGSLRGLAQRLSRDLDRPVFDNTGIRGLFVSNSRGAADKGMDPPSSPSCRTLDSSWSLPERRWMSSSSTVPDAFPLRTDPCGNL